MKNKPLIILLFFGYTLKINLASSNSYFSFSLLTFENLQNHFIAQFFNFSFWRNSPIKRKLLMKKSSAVDSPYCLVALSSFSQLLSLCLDCLSRLLVLCVVCCCEPTRAEARERAKEGE
jgi:hypothetical protein